MDLLVTIMSKMRKELQIIRYVWINPMLLNTMLFIRIVTLVEWLILTYILIRYSNIIIEYINDPMMVGGYIEIFTAITVVKITFYYFCEYALIDYRTVISY